MSPCLLTGVQMRGLHRLLRRLVRGETRPLVAAAPARFLRLVEITFRLTQPITSSIGRGASIGEGHAARPVIVTSTALPPPYVPLRAAFVEWVRRAGYVRCISSMPA